MLMKRLRQAILVMAPKRQDVNCSIINPGHGFWGKFRENWLAQSQAALETGDENSLHRPPYSYHTIRILEQMEWGVQFAQA